MMKRLFNIGLWACLLALVSCINDPKVKEQDNTPSGEKGVVLLNVATRTVDGTTFDYILSIFKNEAGKSMLVRKYDSSKSDMQKPEYIWLLEGDYTAVVEPTRFYMLVRRTEDGRRCLWQRLSVR